MSTVTLRIQVDRAGASENIGAVKRDLQGMGETGAQAGAQASGGVNGLSSAINGAKAAVGAFLAVYAGIQALSGVVRLADEYQGLSDRLRLATGDSAAFAAAQSGVFAVAQQTGAALGAVTDLYVGLSRSTEQLGLSQSELLTITAAINQSFAISGTSAASAEAATRQLGQAFASGVLRGDEFNSMMENAPGLASALASSLGVTTGELRKMAAEGKLTSDVLATGLLQQAPAIAEQFGQMGLTVGRAFQQVSNSVLVAVGAFNESTGAGASLASTLSQLAGVIANIATLFVATGERSAAASDDVGVLTRAFQGLAIASALVVNAVQAMVQFIAGALEGTADLIGGVAAAAEAASTGAFDRTVMLLSLDFKGFAESQLGAATAAFGAMKQGAVDATDAVSRGLDGVAAETGDFSNALTAILAPLEQSATKTESLAGALGAVAAPAKQSAEQLKAVEKAASAAASASDALTKEQERLVAAASPLNALYVELAQKLRAVDEWETKLAASEGLSAAEAERLRAVRVGLTAALVKELAAVQSLQSPYETYLAKLNDERRLLGLSAVERARAESQTRATTAVMAFANAERERGNGLMIEEIEKLILLEQRLDDEALSAGRAAAAAQEWRQYWEGAVGAVSDAFGDFVASGFKSFKDLKDGLVDIAKQIVSDLVSTFIRARITIPITTALSGAGGQAGAAGGGGFSSLLSNPFALVAGAIGAISALASLFGRDKPPDVRFGGENASIRNREGRFSTVFGGVQAGSRQISYEDMIEPIQQFDLAIQGIVQATGGGAEQLDAIRGALSTWEVDLRGSAATAENVLGSRFNAILSAFGSDVQGFVGNAGTLEERLGRFTDALGIAAEAASGNGISSSFDDLATLFTRFRLQGEDVADTFQRLSFGAGLIDDTLLMLGGTFNGTRLQAATFAGELIELAGGLDQFSARLNGALEALFSEPERNQFLASQAQAALNESLRGLNISGTGIESIREQLRTQLRDALAAGNSALVNELLIAGNALGSFTTAVGRLGDEATGALTGSFGSSNAAGTIRPGSLTSPAGTAVQTQIQAVQTTNTILQTQTSILQQIATNTGRGTVGVGLTPGASPKTGGDATAVLVQIKGLIEQASRTMVTESIKRTTGANNRTSAA